MYLYLEARGVWAAQPVVYEEHVGEVGQLQLLIHLLLLPSRHDVRLDNEKKNYEIFIWSDQWPLLLSHFLQKREFIIRKGFFLKIVDNLFYSLSVLQSCSRS